MHLQTRSVFTGVDGASYFDFVRGVLFMSELRKAAQQALEAMKRSNNRYLHGTRYMDVAITALRAAIAQPEPEPVAYRFQSPATEEWLLGLEPPVGSRWEIEALYTVPPQRKPLTNGEIYTAYITATNQTLRAQDEKLALEFARAIERAHGIGGEE